MPRIPGVPALWAARPYKGLSELGNRKINLSSVFAGQNIGIKEDADKVWLVSFMQYDLGFFDPETGRITSAENPFGPKSVLGLNGSSKHWHPAHGLVFSS